MKGPDWRTCSICGVQRHADEHTMPESWRAVACKNTRAYGSARTAAANKDGDGYGNDAYRGGERLWFSPSCLDRAPGLFGVGA